MVDISIELPELELYSVIYDDGYFKFNGYSMKASYELNKIKTLIEDTSTIFFQTEYLINTECINDLGGDHETIAFEFANLLFDNFEKAKHLFLALNKEYKFNEFIVTFEGVNEPTVYEVDGITYDVYYSNELINFAKQYYYDYLNDSNFMDLLDTNDSLENLKIFMYAINTKALANFIRDELKNRELLTSVSSETFNNDLELIETFINMNDDYSTETFILDVIVENDLFDAWKFAEKEMDNEVEAINYINGTHGTLLSEFTLSNKNSLYILERD